MQKRPRGHRATMDGAVSTAKNAKIPGSLQNYPGSLWGPTGRVPNDLKIHGFLKLKLVENTPHAPGMLFVGVAPHTHIGERSDVRSETNIFNLGTHEFGLVANHH